jgi:hypothetical protein
VVAAGIRLSGGRKEERFQTAGSKRLLKFIDSAKGRAEGRERERRLPQRRPVLGVSERG